MMDYIRIVCLFLIGIVIFPTSHLFASDTSKILIERSIVQKEIHVLPKVKINTNDFIYVLYLSNNTDEKVSINITHRIPKEVHIDQNFSALEIGPYQAADVVRFISVCDKFRGYIPSDLVFVTGESGKKYNVNNTKPKFLEVSLINQKIFALVYAFVIQLGLIITISFFVGNNSVTVVNKFLPRSRAIKFGAYPYILTIFIIITSFIFIGWDYYSIYCILF